MSILDTTVDFDREMIDRYNHSGPRYTSYPTAVTFHEQFDITDYDRACEQGNEDPVPAPLSLYFHIPFCDTVCFYCGCNKIVTKHKARALPYLEILGREIEIVSAKFAGDREVEQLHFGGGTPTFLTADEISQVMWKVQSHFNALPSEKKDFSIEIDPRSVDPHYIQVLGALGFNRYSLGVQDVDIKVQRAVNRVQSVKMTRQIMDACRDAGAKSINIDLIYGLPFQSPESFKETVDVVISMYPERLSIFNYAHLPEMFKPQRRINTEDLPSPEEKLQILQNTIEQLTGAGYVYIGMDHFARPDDELVIARETGHLHRNFQGYTTHGDCDLVAMGVSAISKIRGVFSQNAKDEASYTDALKQDMLPIIKGYVTNAEDRLRASVIQRIACYGDLDMPYFESKFGIKFKAHFVEELNKLKPMIEDGLVAIDDTSLKVTPKGRLLVRNICMAFDEYTKVSENTRFSKAI